MRKRELPREVRFTVPHLTPPSVNHYVVHTRAGKHFKTGEAEAFLDAIAICARGDQCVEADEYAVTLAIFLGKGKKGDIDNFAKVTIDGLVNAGVIRSDALVTELHISKHRDWAKPRTEIHVRALEEE